MEVANLLEEISANSFDVGSWLWVDIMHINDPHNFYVRPLTYRKYLPLLNTQGDHPVESEVNIGDVFLYFSSEMKHIVRGKVVCKTEYAYCTTYKMFAMDIGCIEESVSLIRLWKTVNQSEVPSLVTLCELADCAPLGETWDNDATDAMKYYVGGERAKMIIRSKAPDKLVVELYNSCPDDIAHLLALTRYSNLMFAHNSANRFESPHVPCQKYPQKKLKVDEILHVRIQSGTLQEQFYVTTIKDYQLYLKDREKYTSYALSQNEIVMEDLKLNAPIGVNYPKNSQFERGWVKELVPEFNSAKVNLVDWGIVVEKSVKNMRPLPDWYLRIPTRALWCILHSDQSLSNNLVSLSLPGVEFQMTIKEVGDNDVSPNIVLISPLKSR